MKRLAAAVALALAAVALVAAGGGSAQEERQTPKRATHLIGVEVDAFRRTERGLRECPRIEPSRRPVGGRCVFEATGSGQFGIVTPFGGMALADCELRFAIQMDFVGIATMGELSRSGPSPCADIRSCERSGDSSPPPWLGEIETDGKGGYRVLLAACLDTCVGWFEGTLTLALERIAGQWRLRADRAMLGQSGIQIRGEWWLDAPDLELVVDDDGGVPRDPGLE